MQGPIENDCRDCKGRGQGIISGELLAAPDHDGSDVEWSCPTCRGSGVMSCTTCGDSTAILDPKAKDPICVVCATFNAAEVPHVAAFTFGVVVPAISRMARARA